MGIRVDSVRSIRERVMAGSLLQWRQDMIADLGAYRAKYKLSDEEAKVLRDIIVNTTPKRKARDKFNKALQGMIEGRKS